MKQLIKFRKKYRLFHQEKELLGIDQSGCGMPDVSYHGEMAWRASTEVASRQIGIYYSSQDKEEADCFVAYKYALAGTRICVAGIKERPEMVTEQHQRKKGF